MARERMIFVNLPVSDLAACQARGEARPALKQALADQMAAHAANQPQLKPEGEAA